MERSERTLVPEWLRSSGTVTGGGNSAHQFASSSSNPDVSSLLHHGRHKNSRKISDFDSPRSAFLDRTYSLNSGRSSSNVSAKHAYSSFSRSHRDKVRERGKERMNFGEHWDSGSSDPLESILTSRVEKLGGISTSRVNIDTLRRSHSLVYSKQGEPLPRRITVDSGDNGNSNHHITNGLHSGGTIGSSIHKAMFEKEFPSLGTEERPGMPEIARVSSPVLGPASQSVPVGKSALIDGEGWTSTLAEVLNVVGSSSTGSSPVSTTSSGAPSVTCGLNMAEALAQAPSGTHTVPMLSVTTQRREELAIKQSRQLIPVTPSMPKVSALNSVDKSKAKPAVIISEMNIAVKTGSQTVPSIHRGNHSPHNGHTKSEMPKTSGKLLVLKPGWDNGVSSPTKKDIASPTTIANNRITTSQHVVPPVNSVPARNSNSPKFSARELKSVVMSPIAGFTVEKRPSLAQTQSRNEFFNLLKKKTSTNTSGGLSDSYPQIPSSTIEKSEVAKEVIGDSATAHADDGTAASSNGDTCSDERVKNTSTTNMVYPDEEEAAFLRSLGWEENTGEDEGLTEEEINAFYEEYMKLRPSLKLCRGMQPMLSQSVSNNLDGASSDLSSSDSGSEA